jgi:hypothetical protein
MLVEIRPQLACAFADGRRLRHVSGVEERRRVLASQMPEQALLSHALRNPPQGTPFRARHPASRVALLAGLAALALRFGDRLAEPVRHPPEESSRRFAAVGLVRHLAIQLVA